jgi:uncharacterized OsmC-like protein
VAKELRYGVDLTASGGLTDEKGVGLDMPAGWTPEHLLLAALLRCSVKSLRHHAEHAGVDVRSASASGRTLVSKRETDDRYALVDTEADLTVEIAPELDPAALADLLALAERDCFVGSSLTAKPRYRWVVNGHAVQT